MFIPVSWIALATSSEISVSFSTNTSPVVGSIMSSKDIFPVILLAKLNFWLNLNLPTLDKSYLLWSKNKPLNKFDWSFLNDNGDEPEKH